MREELLTIEPHGLTPVDALKEAQKDLVQQLGFTGNGPCGSTPQLLSCQLPQLGLQEFQYQPERLRVTGSPRLQ
jgi:hypothetical protein